TGTSIMPKKTISSSKRSACCTSPRRAKGVPAHGFPRMRLRTPRSALSSHAKWPGLREEIRKGRMDPAGEWRGRVTLGDADFRKSLYENDYRKFPKTASLPVL